MEEFFFFLSTNFAKRERKKKRKETNCGIKWRNIIRSDHLSTLPTKSTEFFMKRSEEVQYHSENQFIE